MNWFFQLMLVVTFSALASFAHASEEPTSVPTTEKSAIFKALDDVITKYDKRVDVDSELMAFTSEDESFVAILGDATELMKGGGVHLADPQFEEIRSQLTNIFGLKFQSEEKLAKSHEANVTIFKSRILHRYEDKTIVINEEHRYASDARAYTLILVSELKFESKALRAREALAAKFAKLPTVARLNKHWWGGILIPSAQAQARESARARQQGNRVNGVDRIPRCMNIGIADPNDVRRVRETNVTPLEGLRSCGTGVWNAVKAMAEGMASLAATAMAPVRTNLTRSRVLNSAIDSSINNMPAQFRMMVGAARIGAGVAQVVAEKRTQIFVDAWNAVTSIDDRVACMTNQARVRFTCRVLTDIASVVVPGGAVVRGSRLASALTRDSLMRVARGRAGQFFRAAARAAPVQATRRAVAQPVAAVQRTVRRVADPVVRPIREAARARTARRAEAAARETEEQVSQVTASIHTDWRATYRAANGDAPRFKPVPDSELRASETAQQALTRLRSAGARGLDVQDGKLVQNINQPAESILPSLNARLNGGPARQYVELVRDGRAFRTGDDFERAASDVHEVWKANNQWQLESAPHLFEPYARLSPAEKLKDLDVLAMTLREVNPQALQSSAYLNYRSLLTSQIANETTATVVTNTSTGFTAAQALQSTDTASSAGGQVAASAGLVAPAAARSRMLASGAVERAPLRTDVATDTRSLGVALGRSDRFAFYNGGVQGRQTIGRRTLVPGRTYTTVERDGKIIIGENFAENGVYSGSHLRLGTHVAKDFPVSPSNFADPNFSLRGGSIRVNADGSVDISGYHNRGNPGQTELATENMVQAFEEAGVRVRVATPERLPDPPRPTRSYEPERTEPRNLEEQLAMQEARSGAGTAKMETFDDARFQGGDWEKVEHVRQDRFRNNIVVHYMRNRTTGETTQFKFKNAPSPERSGPPAAAPAAAPAPALVQAPASVVQAPALAPVSAPTGWFRNTFGSARGPGNLPASSPARVAANPSAYRSLGPQAQARVESAVQSGRLRMVRLDPSTSGPPVAVDIPAQIIPGRYYVTVETPNNGLVIAEYNSVHGGHTALARAVGVPVVRKLDREGAAAGGMTFYDDGVEVSGKTLRYPDDRNARDLARRLESMGLRVRSRTGGSIRETNPPAAARSDGAIHMMRMGP